MLNFLKKGYLKKNIIEQNCSMKELSLLGDSDQFSVTSVPMPGMDRHLDGL